VLTPESPGGGAVLESLSSEEMQFIKAIENFKAEHGKLFPSWSEVLKILKELGYRKVARKPEKPERHEKNERHEKHDRHEKYEKHEKQEVQGGP
jgi:hypothetical protein